MGLHCIGATLTLALAGCIVTDFRAFARRRGSPSRSRGPEPALMLTSMDERASNGDTALRLPIYLRCGMDIASAVYRAAFEGDHPWAGTTCPTCEQEMEPVRGTVLWAAESTEEPDSPDAGQVILPQVVLVSCGCTPADLRNQFDGRFVHLFDDQKAMVQDELSREAHSLGWSMQPKYIVARQPAPVPVVAGSRRTESAA